MGGMAVREDDSLLVSRVRELMDNMERLHLTEYMRYVNDWRRVLFVNFLSGIARGFGFAVGFALLGAAVLVILQRIAARSIPGMEEFLEQVLLLVERNMR